MFGRLGAHLRANLVAYLALFVALGGTGAYAAERIGSADIKRNAVLSKHVKNKAVRIADIAPGARGMRAPELVWKESSLTGTETYKWVTVQCPAGKFAISGGAIMDGDDGNVYITESTPQSGSPGAPQDTWFIGANQEQGVASGNWGIEGFAVCVKIG